MLATGSPQDWQALVGREAQIGRLTAAVEALGSGRGAVLEIAGDPGAGKTRLLALLAERAGAAGARIARSTALRGTGAPRQLFRDAWADVPAPGLADSDEEAVFRTVRAGLAGWAAGPGGGSVAGRPGGPGSGGGAVLFDDVHLADEASVRLLARLVRTPVPGPLLLAVGHCPRRTGSVLLEALDDGARIGTVVRIELDPLDETAVEELLTAWYGPGDHDRTYIEQIRAAADGNPRNLRILTAAGWRPELWPDSPGEDTGALLREAAAMGVELDALSAEQTAVANAAAVLAGPFRPEDAARISGLGLAGTLNALDELVRADVIRHVAPGVRFAFRHPLLGHVAHERASLPTLLGAHQRALDLLSTRGASAVDLARHAEHLVGADGAAAAPLLARGAAEILPDAPATAVRWLGLALQTPVGERPSAERAALMLECCRALSAAGRFDEARSLAHDVLRDDTHLTGPLRLRASAMRVAAERQLGRYDEAAGVAAAALERLPRPLDAGAAELVFELGVLHMYRGTYGQAREAVQEVVTALTSDAGRPDDRLAAAIRVLAAFGDAYLGLTADAIPALVEGARLADSLPDSDVARIPELLAMLGCGEMFMEGYTAAGRHLHRCLTIARKGGPQQMKLNTLLGLAYIDQQTGQLARSERRAEEARRVARATGAADGVSMSEALLVGAMIWSRGRAESASIVAAAEHAVRIARPGNGWWSGSAAMQLALVRMVSGDAAGCVDALLEGGGGPELRKLQPAYRPMLLSMLSTAALRAGDGALARQAALGADEAAESSGLSVQRAYVTRAQAALHAADGEHPIAAKLFEQSALGFRRAGRPVQHAWTLAAGAGSAALVHGLSVAGSWLDAAEEVARIHGAVRIEEEIAEIRALLVPPAQAVSPAATVAQSEPPSPAGPLHSDVRALLTAREQEIAALVATGRRSRAIADELFLSHRTVETHLARIYRKLNVSSRTALAHLLQGADNVGTE
ncbi:helix-turn-helix transcriptional regulator [Catenulispora subtropica]|uniref:helix-turn-helix transcriptional regulator n=1 Tax=Catenulispora subtropica TaxID=450798 RepID=UPI0031D52CE8